MKIISTNIGKATTFLWNGREEQTGIFKSPTNEPLLLGKMDVLKDTVIDRVHHIYLLQITTRIGKECILN